MTGEVEFGSHTKVEYKGIAKTTDKAFFMDFIKDGVPVQIPVPQSLVRFGKSSKKIFIEEWFCTQEGLI